MIRNVYALSRISDRNFFPSRIQGSEKHWIPDQDPQHWSNPVMSNIYGERNKKNTELYPPILSAKPFFYWPILKFNIKLVSYIG